MPTISFSLKDLQHLVGKKITLEHLEEYAPYAKGDVEGYDKETDEVKIDFGDTNLPYLWSVEGFAFLLKGILGSEKGCPSLKINKGNYKIIVDKSVSSIRPFIGGFVAKGHKIDDYLIKQLIQLQEKICENYGRKRKKVAVGIYSYDKITWPIHYKATDPESVKFVPLEFKREMTQQEIIEDHPKGKEYATLLQGFKKYPLLVDDKKEVLSFPPIINSNFTGKIEIGDEHLFIEATGTDLETIQLTLNIFAFALQERGCELYGVDVEYGDKTIRFPLEFNDSFSLSLEEVKRVLGIEISEAECKKCLERMRYSVNKGKIHIPDFRRDIMHPIDIIEDVAIGFNFMNITPASLTTYTRGQSRTIVSLIDNIRDLIVGFGCQEIFSPILTNKNLLYEKMNNKDSGTVEISSPMSESFSVVRSSLLPILMDVLSKNKHAEYPQKIFEQGLVTTRKGENIEDHEVIALVSAHHKAEYTEIRQYLDALLRALGISGECVDIENSSFIPGRIAEVNVKGKSIGILGEIHPQVLENFGVEVPVCAMELNLSELFKMISK